MLNTRLPASMTAHTDPHLHSVRLAYTQQVSKLSPQVRTQLTELGQQLAVAEARAPASSLGQLVARAQILANQARVKGQLQTGDVASLAFLVLAEATHSADADLQLIVAETKAQTTAKQALRDIATKVQSKSTSSAPKLRFDALHSLAVWPHHNP